MSEQKQQEFPVEEFVQETHITVGELLMQNRMANKIVAKLQAENAALKQRLEEKEITDLDPDEDPFRSNFPTQDTVSHAPRRTGVHIPRPINETRVSVLVVSGDKVGRRPACPTPLTFHRRSVCSLRSHLFDQESPCASHFCLLSTTTR